MDTFVEFVLVFRPLHRSVDHDGADRSEDRQSLAAGRSVYRRHRARDPAPALFALLHPRHEARPATSTSTSRSPACSRKAWWCTRPIAPRTATGSSRPTSRSKAWATRAARRSPRPARRSRSARSRRCRSRRRTPSTPTTSSPPTAPTPRAGSCSPNSPPERDVIWTEEGVQGAWRFVQRLWRLVGEIADITGAGNAPGNFRRKRADRAQGRAPRARARLRRHRPAALQPLRRPHLRIRQRARRRHRRGRNRARPPTSPGRCARPATSWCGCSTR